MAKKKQNKGKAVPYELIPATAEPYEILRAARKQHPELEHCKLVLAWRVGKSSSAGGCTMLGKCIRVSDLNKELAEYDFIIVLNQDAWAAFLPNQKLALLDHDLSHAAPVLDDEGEQKRDERGRRLWKMRRHDLEEFRGTVERYGCWLNDIVEFVRAGVKDPQLSLLPPEEPPEESTSKVLSITQ
jgi:hypothetical protein